jgi:hypothetical protein
MIKETEHFLDFDILAFTMIKIYHDEAIRLKEEIE